ncbi:MAG: 2-hydroxyacid dehydrogenase [Chloroflexota bacterium]
MSDLLNVLYAGPTVPEYVALAEEFLPAGCRLDVVARHTPETRPLLESAHFVVGLAPLPADTIAGARNLRLIQVLGAGYDMVDLVAARLAHVPVATTGDANARSVAEHILALILAVYRRLPQADQAVKEGRWPQIDYYRGGSHELAGKTLGLVGLGNVGRVLAQMVSGFDLDVLYTKRTRLLSDDERSLDVSYVPLAELLARADAVSLQLSLTPEAKGLIGRRELAGMKESAILVNTSRGGVVDQQALVERLSAGKLAGAGLDVFADEPLGADSPLRGFANVVLTPHVAGASEEAVRRTFAVSFGNIARMIAGHPLRNVVQAS